MTIKTRAVGGERLVADVGGTHVRFAIVGDDPQELLEVETLQCADFTSLDCAIAEYTKAKDLKGISHVCLAVAGPVHADRAELPNNQWSFSRLGLEATLGVTTTVINDFTAQALSIDALKPSDLSWLGSPRPTPGGIRGILGPGTGLGIAVTTTHGEIIPSEGGHVGFAPVNEHEIELLRALFPRYRRVSVERLLSGPGLENIYWANLRLSGQSARYEDPTPSAREISRMAEQGDPIARRTVNDFFDIFASYAGDVALFTWATSGIYLSGGMVRKLAGFLDIERFRARFEDKGRFTGFCESVPVARVTYEYPGLLGCATYMEQLTRQAAGLSHDTTPEHGPQA